MIYKYLLTILICIIVSIAMVEYNENEDGKLEIVSAYAPFNFKVKKSIKNMLKNEKNICVFFEEMV